MNVNDWITDEEYTEAYKQAEVIAESFMANKFLEGEELWEEIWVNGKAFDINCYEEDFDMDEDERTTPVHIVIHPTIEDGDGWRTTDGETYTRLFSYYPATGLTIKYEEDDDE